MSWSAWTWIILTTSVLFCDVAWAQDHTDLHPGPTQEYVYKSISEKDLKITVDFPPGWKESDRRPAIVFFYGGGWTSGSIGQFRPQAEYFAKRGLVAGRVDYRVKSRDDVTPDQCVMDALSAMRWVRKRAPFLGIDPNRLVAAGGSAGGHLAACTFFTERLNNPGDDLFVSPQPNALVLFNPALDLSVDHPRVQAMVGDLSPEVRAQISPMKGIRKEMPPTLIIDGTGDFLYPQISEFVQKAKEAGAPVEVLWAEGEPHGFFNQPPWLEKTTLRVDEFLQSLGYLKAKPKVPLPTKAGPPEDTEENH